MVREKNIGRISVGGSFFSWVSEKEVLKYMLINKSPKKTFKYMMQRLERS